MTPSPTPTPHDAALDVQRAYYAGRRPTTMRKSDSAYARRHLAEVLALSDRVAVIYKGRFVAVLSRAEATEDIIGSFMTGASGEFAA